MLDILYIAGAIVVTFICCVWMYRKEYRGLSAKEIGLMEFIPCICAGLLWPFTIFLGLIALVAKGVINAAIAFSDAWDEAQPKPEKDPEDPVE